MSMQSGTPNSVTSKDGVVYGDEYNPYLPPETRVAKRTSQSSYKVMMFWNIYLVIYVGLPIALLFSADIIKLFQYGNNEIILYTVRSHPLVEGVNWATFVVTTIAIIGFMRDARIATQGLWQFLFWLCLIWTAGYYVYEVIREFSSHSSTDVTVAAGFTAFNFIKNLVYAAPALYAMYRYCYVFRHIWKRDKETPLKSFSLMK